MSLSTISHDMLTVRGLHSLSTSLILFLFFFPVCSVSGERPLGADSGEYQHLAPKNTIKYILIMIIESMAMRLLAETEPSLGGCSVLCVCVREVHRPTSGAGSCFHL